MLVFGKSYFLFCSDKKEKILLNLFENSVLKDGIRFTEKNWSCRVKSQVLKKFCFVVFFSNFYREFLFEVFFLRTFFLAALQQLIYYSEVYLTFFVPQIRWENKFTFRTAFYSTFYNRKLEQTDDMSSVAINLK